MKKKFIKLGFYVLTFILLILSISLVVEYRFLCDGDIREFKIEKSSENIVWLLIISGLFGLSTILLILKDWIKRKRLPFYIGIIAFVIILLIFLTALFVYN